ncbi:hypothetical protein SKAU_G00322700 [Synaphobranchus kaupii]|uniref:Uncharacterized protein n=1 Tax=Synaphobranchus kaupii TaxID=118154 RepID=A0A9Q1EP17_SYNKA|nr:hypothetical protein SKAU_G00322700 [Synaphobranchus kaupii]
MLYAPLPQLHRHGNLTLTLAWSHDRPSSWREAEGRREDAGGIRKIITMSCKRKSAACLSLKKTRGGTNVRLVALGYGGLSLQGSAERACAARLTGASRRRTSEDTLGPGRRNDRTHGFCYRRRNGGEGSRGGGGGVPLPHRAVARESTTLPEAGTRVCSSSLPATHIKDEFWDRTGH